MIHAVRILLLCFCALAAAAQPPKLVVAIVVDQMRADYLERFKGQFGRNGFRLFLDRGATLSSAVYDYAPTVTGPGHASILSGSGPAQHGIIGNDWYDRRLRKSVGCVADSTVKGVGTDPGRAQASPRNFIGSNLADEMRLHFRSKVVSVSIKDRGAILPAGMKPAGAYWFDGKNGNFVTSTYYMTNLPVWLDAFNSRHLAQSFMGRTWPLLADPKHYLYPDDSPGEGNLTGEKKPVFDHVIAHSTNNVDNVLTSPFANELVLQVAKAAVEGENLGSRNVPDLLCVSFSSLDAVGHTFGPYSREIQDMTLRLDRQLEELFGFLDKRIGLKNIMIVLTADHGVAPAPEFARTEGLSARRWNHDSFLTNLVAKLNDRFGPAPYLQMTNSSNGQLFFDHKVIHEKGHAPEDLARFIREVALDSGDFQAVYSRDQLLEGRVSDLLGQRIQRGYNAERSGDLVLLVKPYLLTGGPTGTTHGTPYSYDAQVPVLFYGRAFNRGRFPQDFHITDIAPTLSAALHINEPALAIGRVFTPLLAN